MKHTNLSVAGVALGLFLTLASSIRYFILFPDTDKGLFFGLIGLVIVAVAWNYAGRIALKNEIEHLQHTLTDVEQYIVDQESIGVNKPAELGEI